MGEESAFPSIVVVVDPPVGSENISAKIWDSLVK